MLAQKGDTLWILEPEACCTPWKAEFVRWLGRTNDILVKDASTGEKYALKATAYVDSHKLYYTTRPEHYAYVFTSKDEADFEGRRHRLLHAIAQVVTSPMNSLTMSQVMRMATITEENVK